MKSHNPRPDRALTLIAVVVMPEDWNRSTQRHIYWKPMERAGGALLTLNGVIKDFGVFVGERKAWGANIWGVYPSFGGSGE